MYLGLRNVPGMLLLKWYGVVDGIRCLVLPFGGISLVDGQICSPVLAMQVFKQLLEILHSIHSMGVIHRDIKPGNILMDDSQECILVDFGLSIMFKGVYGEHI